MIRPPSRLMRPACCCYKWGLHAPVVIEMRSYHDTPSGVTVEFLPAADCEVATLQAH